jgi:hypothetical protein
MLGSSFVSIRALLPVRSMLAEASGSTDLMALVTALTQCPQLIFSMLNSYIFDLHELRLITDGASHGGKVKRPSAKMNCDVIWPGRRRTKRLDVREACDIPSHSADAFINVQN